MRPCPLALLLGVAFLPAGCARQQTTAAASPAADPAPAAESFPRIRAVTPEAVPFTDNRAIVGVLHVTYEILAPELVTSARLELRSDRSVVARQAVPIEGHGEVDFHVNDDVIIGPTVRFQLQCSSGETNWLPLGALGPAPPRGSPRIDKITPDHISEGPDLGGATSGADSPVQFSLWGSGFERDCKGRFTVNNSQPVDAPTIFWNSQKVLISITRRQLGGLDWSNPRYLELRLVTERFPRGDPQQSRFPDRKADIRPLPIIDP